MRTSRNTQELIAFLKVYDLLESGKFIDLIVNESQEMFENLLIRSIKYMPKESMNGDLYFGMRHITRCFIVANDALKNIKIIPMDETEMTDEEIIRKCIEKHMREEKSAFVIITNIIPKDIEEAFDEDNFKELITIIEWLYSKTISGYMMFSAPKIIQRYKEIDDVLYEDRVDMIESILASEDKASLKQAKTEIKKNITQAIDRVKTEAYKSK